MEVYLDKTHKTIPISTLILTFESTEKIKEYAPQLRGFFATKFNEYQLLHQHNADKFIYKYPLIQYKVIDGTPMVIGINEGTEVLKEIYDKFDEIRLGENSYKIMGKGIQIKNQDFGLTEEFHTHLFATPWFALSQKNYRSYYMAGTKVERNELLNRTLIGNLLSMSKTLDYNVPDRIKASVNYRIKKGRLKSTNIMTFTGTFITNFLIPDYFGIGRSVSRGFGTVKRVS
ncbi:hypothetical protein IPdc08_01592 [archaeon]|nr:hypothetical protein IPdc08_01592 [archaeon]